MLKIFKDLFWISGGQFFGVICNFITLKILTNELSIAEFGYYTLYISIILFIRQVIFDPISTVAAKESVVKNSSDNQNQITFFVVNFLGKIISTILIVLIICFISYQFFIKRNLTSDLFSINIIILSCYVYLIFNGIQGIYLNIMNVMKMRKVASLGISLDSAIKLCFIYICTIIYSANLETIFVSIALGSLSNFLIILYIYNTKIINLSASKTFDIDSVKKITALSIPLVLPISLHSLRTIGDRWIIGSLAGIESLGIYGAFMQLGFLPLSLVVGIIQTYLVPDMYKLAHENPRELVRKINVGILISVFCIFLITLIISIFNEFIINFVLGNEYISFSYLFIYFVISGAIFGICGVINIALIALFSTFIYSVLISSTILVSLMIFAIMTYLYGLDGCAISLILSSIIYLVIYLTALNKINR